jgi:hypothetical protein
MREQLRDPLVPPECDLRDFAFLPLEGRRLLTSETWILGTPEERCAALCLWIEAWYQVPAASLPDSDRILSHLSQAGARWSKVKEHALRGWVKATDGRLYHAILAEKAVDAWARKQAQRERTAAARAARQRQTAVQSVTGVATASVTETVTGSKGQGQGQRQKISPPAAPSAGGGDKRGRKAWGTPDDEALAKRMFDAIRTVAPSAKEPTWPSWANAVRLMREQDGRTHEQMWTLFEWANQDSFWRAQILSPTNLRGKWTQLEARMLATQAPKPTVPQDEVAKVYAENDSGALTLTAEYPPGEPEDLACRALAEYRTRLRNARNLVVRLNGTQSRFSVAELRPHQLPTGGTP